MIKTGEMEVGTEIWAKHVIPEVMYRARVMVGLEQKISRLCFLRPHIRTAILPHPSMILPMYQ
jgi:hypothetical protein